MDFEQARHNMVEQQIRTWEVLDNEVLELFETIHREDFVPQEWRRLALADISVPLAHGQVTMTPKAEARMLQSLEIRRSDRVLEIGTGCAFVTALLASRGAQVHSVDIFPEFIREAGAKLSRYGIGNVALHEGDAARGWPAAGSCDVIAVTGSVPALPEGFLAQLAPGGRMFAILGQSPVMEAVLFRKDALGHVAREVLFETDIPPLLGISTPSRFEF